jgi:hypothetical protein
MTTTNNTLLHVVWRFVCSGTAGVFLLLACVPAHAIEPIRVLVAASPKAIENGTNPAVIADRIESAMESVVLSTRLAHQREILADPYPLPSLYVLDVSSSTDLETAVNFIRNGLDGPLAEARDTAVPPITDGYDVIVLVVDDGSDCGVATRPTDFSNWTENAEDSAFIVFDQRELCMVDFSTFVIGHEFGHILGGEHQTVGFGGVENDMNGNDPVEHNHPVYEFSAYTILGSSGTLNSTDSNRQFLQYSRYLTPETLGSTGVPEGRYEMDMFLLIVEETWDMVASYRPKPPPPPPDCGPYFTVSFNQCDGVFANMQLSATLPGFEVTNAKYQVKFGSGGSWGTIFEGILTCPSQSSIGTFFANALLQTAQGDSYCQIPVHVPACEPGGGGGIIW